MSDDIERWNNMMNRWESSNNYRALDRKLDRIIQLLEQGVRVIMAKIDDVEAAVAAEVTVGDSMVVLLNQLGDLIKATDPNNPRLAALADTVNAKASEWAAAVVANTPAAPPTP